MSKNFVLDSSEQWHGSCGNESSIEFPVMVERSSTKDSAASNFSQVVFPEISDYFPPGKDIRVTYVLTDTMEPSSRDWIGLFRVGWSSAREYLTFVWAPKICPSQKNDCSVIVTFSAYYLPLDRNEFFQFCYVSKQGHIRGASTPFQFREPSDCDHLIEVEDETGMIVLKTKSVALKEQLDTLNKLKDEMEKRLQELMEHNCTLSNALSDANCQLNMMKVKVSEKDEECMELRVKLEDTIQSTLDADLNLKATEEKMAMVKKALGRAELSISDLKREEYRLSDQLTESNLKHSSEVTLLNEKLDAKIQRIAELQLSMDHLTEDLMAFRVKTENLLKMHGSLEEAQRSNAALRKECDEAKAKVVRYQEEKELFKDQFVHSEEARRDIMQQLTLLKKATDHKDAEIQENVSKILAFEEKVRMLKIELNDVSKQNSVQKSALESQLSNIEDKLNASEASKRLISNELTEARDNRDKLMSELHRVKKEKEQFIREVEESSRQLTELEKNYVKLKEGAETGREQFGEKDGKHSDEKVKAEQREHELLTVLEQEKEENIISDLRLKVEDLHTRLSMGAAAYTEKYMECHKLERRLKKLQSQKPAKIAVSHLQTSGHSTTSDSQEEWAKTSQVSAGPKIVNGDVLLENSDELQDQQDTGRNFMAKLEQLFMAIADPDIEEQEQSSRLRVRLGEMERRLQSQHSKYRKYKKLYQDEKALHARDSEKSRVETVSLKIEINDLRSAKELIEHENKDLKEQLQEFIKNYGDENAKTKLGVIVPAQSNDMSMRRFGDPLHKDFVNCYPHEAIFSGGEVHSQNSLSLESDFSDDFQRASARFATLGLCPKNRKSDVQEKNCSLSDLAIPSSGVIKRQPTRTSPLIEVISGDEDCKQFAAPVVSSAENDIRHSDSANFKRSEFGHDFI